MFAVGSVTRKKLLGRVGHHHINRGENTDGVVVKFIRLKVFLMMRDVFSEGGIVALISRCTT